MSISRVKGVIEPKAWIFKELELRERRYEELTQQLSQPEVYSSPDKLTKLSREHAEIADIVSKYRELKEISSALEQTRSLLDDDQDEELLLLAREEIEALEGRRSRLLRELEQRLSPQDPLAERSAIMEIRAAAGGEEAALFAADLFRMYSRYAQAKNWEVEILDSSPSRLEGFKEVVFLLKGKGAYGQLRFEGGVHRVQRVPVTEASGRLHTSTATVAVFPEAQEQELVLQEEDLEIEFFQSTGPGGQNVNKVATAVRLRHIPTGMVVVCREGRSQFSNREKALSLLRSRLLEQKRREEKEAESQSRRSQIGSGERAEKIRTYNFPQNRVTDHRLNLSFYNLSQILDGELDELITALANSLNA